MDMNELKQMVLKVLISRFKWSLYVNYGRAINKETMEILKIIHF